MPGASSQQRAVRCHCGILWEGGPSLTGSLFPFSSSSAPGSTLDPYSPCNKNCECQTDSFTPVCGADGITYLSACFAGCNSTVRRFSRGMRWSGNSGSQSSLTATVTGRRGRPRVPCFVFLRCDFSQPLPCSSGGFSISRMGGLPGPSC